MQPPSVSTDGDACFFRGRGSHAAAIAYARTRSPAAGALPGPPAVRPPAGFVVAPPGIAATDSFCDPPRAIFSFVDGAGRHTVGCFRDHAAAHDWWSAQPAPRPQLLEVIDDAVPVKPHLALRVRVPSDVDPAAAAEHYAAQVRRDVAAVLDDAFLLGGEPAVIDPDADVVIKWRVDEDEGARVVTLFAVVDAVVDARPEIEGDGADPEPTPVLFRRCSAPTVEERSHASHLALALAQTDPPSDNEDAQGGEGVFPPLRYTACVAFPILPVRGECSAAESRAEFLRLCVTHPGAVAAARDQPRLVCVPPPRGTTRGSTAFHGSKVAGIQEAAGFYRCLVPRGASLFRRPTGAELAEIAGAVPSVVPHARDYGCSTVVRLDRAAGGNGACVCGDAAHDDDGGAVALWATVLDGSREALVGCSSATKVSSVLVRLANEPHVSVPRWKRAERGVELFRFEADYADLLGEEVEADEADAGALAPFSGLFPRDPLERARRAWTLATRLDNGGDGQRCSVLRSTTGTGKTHVVLETLLRRRCTFLFVTHRISLAADIARRCGSAGLDVTNYLDAKLDIDPQHPHVYTSSKEATAARRHAVFTHPRVVCGFDSLMVHDAVRGEASGYEVVVVDEIDSFLRHVEETPGKARTSNVASLLRLMGRAKVVLALDAGAGDRVRDFCHDALPDADHRFFWNTKRPPSYTFHVTSDKPAWQKNILASVTAARDAWRDAGDPAAPWDVITVCGSRETELRSLREALIAREASKPEAERWCTEASVVYINGKDDQKSKLAKLKDFPQTLQDAACKVLLFTHALDVGVDIQPCARFNFAELYCTFSNRFVHPPQVLQMVRRVRGLVNREVSMHVESDIMGTIEDMDDIPDVFLPMLHAHAWARGVRGLEHPGGAIASVEAHNACAAFASGLAFLGWFKQLCAEDGHGVTVSDPGWSSGRPGYKRRPRLSVEEAGLIVAECVRLAPEWRFGDEDEARRCAQGAHWIAVARDLCELFRVRSLTAPFVMTWGLPERRELAAGARDLYWGIVDDDRPACEHEAAEYVLWLVKDALGVAHVFDTETVVDDARALAMLRAKFATGDSFDRWCALFGIESAGVGRPAMRGTWRFAMWLRCFVSPILERRIGHTVITGRAAARRGANSGPPGRAIVFVDGLGDGRKRRRGPPAASSFRLTPCEGLEALARLVRLMCVRQESGEVAPRAFREAPDDGQ